MTDPGESAADKVRADLAALADDEVSAPDVPPEVSAGVLTALRSAPPHTPEHQVTGLTGRDHRARRPVARIGAVAGGVAALIAAGLGTTMLLRTSPPAPKPMPAAQHITTTPTIPLSGPQIAELASQQPDFGALTDPARRASCLTGLGYPTNTKILGAKPVHIDDKAAVVLLLAGERPGDLVALAVQPSCSSIDSGLVADTSIPRA